MITIRDRQTGELFDPWDQIGEKRRRLLERTWARVFRGHLLQNLLVGKLAVLFSSGLGRPTKDLHTLIGALILQQLQDLTDAANFEAFAFNISWNYVRKRGHSNDPFSRCVSF